LRGRDVSHVAFRLTWVMDGFRVEVNTEGVDLAHGPGRLTLPRR